MRRLIQRFVWLGIFCLALTAIYGICYALVVSYPNFFLTEYSFTSGQAIASSSSSSGSTVVEVLPMSDSVRAEVTRWSWLNHAHEKYVLSLSLFLSSVFLCSYFRSPQTLFSKGDTVQVMRERLVRRKIGDAFAVYGLFIVLWSLSLLFTPFAGYDSALSFSLLFLAMFLLVVAGIYLAVKTQKAVGKRKTKLGDALTIFGVFLAVWFVVSTFVADLFFSVACLAFALLIAIYFVGKALKHYISKIEAEG